MSCISQLDCLCLWTLSSCFSCSSSYLLAFCSMCFAVAPWVLWYLYSNLLLFDQCWCSLELRGSLCCHADCCFAFFTCWIVWLKLKITIWIYCTIDSTDILLIFAIFEVLMYIGRIRGRSCPTFAYTNLRLGLLKYPGLHTHGICIESNFTNQVTVCTVRLSIWRVMMWIQLSGRACGARKPGWCVKMCAW